jgi:hypothetical protein
MATSLLWLKAIFVDGPRRDGPLKSQASTSSCLLWMITQGVTRGLPQQGPPAPRVTPCMGYKEPQRLAPLILVNGFRDLRARPSVITISGYRTTGCIAASCKQQLLLRWWSFSMGDTELAARGIRGLPG